MKRVALAIVLVVVCGCRRKHVTTTDESEPPAAADNAPAAEPSGTAANPFNEPVLTRPSGATLPDGGTLNNDPRGPRPAEWKPIVDATTPALQACFDTANLPPGEIPVTVHFVVEPRGETGAITVKTTAPKLVQDCLVRVAAGLKFPPYGGPKVERDLGFTWFKREQRAAADGGTAATKQP